MRKIVFLLFFIALAIKANAQDENFEHTEEALGNAEVIQMPACSDQDFEAKIIEAAEAYFEKIPTFSSIAKRKKQLRLMNLKNFEKVSAENFSPQTDYRTANALISIKINEKVPQSDILLCRQKGDEKTALYVIAYPYLDNIKAHIINLDEKNPDYEAVTFIYP